MEYNFWKVEIWGELGKCGYKLREKLDNRSRFRNYLVVGDSG